MVGDNALESCKKIYKKDQYKEGLFLYKACGHCLV